MANDMSMVSLVLQAGPVVQFVMFLLLAASILSWVIIIIKRKYLKQAKTEATRFEDQFWSGINLAELYQRISKRKKTSSGMERIFETGFAEYIRMHKRAPGNTEMLLAGVQRSMKVALAREEERLESNLSWLATIGSISPYVGLFGTVWGIMRSFTALGSVQHASLTMVAPGIAEALIATAMGLFAAIPAVVAYNRYAEQVNRLVGAYENFAEEFATILQRQSHASEMEQNRQPEGETMMAHRSTESAGPVT